MIAQEVEKVFPDWVDTAPNGMKRLNIHGFEALTVEALREVRSENQRQIQERDARIAELERRLVQMEKQMQAVSHEVRELQAAPQSAANVRSNGGM
jgi:DNA repair exonuclease SbcCD ATPase subunit